LQPNGKHPRLVTPPRTVQASLPFARLRKVIAAVERFAGVRGGFLDVSGALAEFDPSGAVTPLGGRVLCPELVQESLHNLAPFICAGPDGGVALAVPIVPRDVAVAFAAAWGFTLRAADEPQWPALGSRFALEADISLFAKAPGLPEMDLEKFTAMADILEAAFCPHVRERAVREGIGGPFSNAVSSALAELTTASKSPLDAAEAIKARDRLEAIYNSTQDAILMLDKDLRIVAANRQFGKTFGAEPDAFVGVTGAWLRRWVIKNAKDPARVSIMLDELLTNPKAIFDDEIELLSPRFMILRFYSAPVTDKTGATIGRLLVFRDITQFRKARTELIGSEKASAIGRIAAGLAHELNNILAGMVAYADYALEEGDGDKIRGALKMSIASAEKASELVARFLAVSGPTESQRQDVDIHKEIERLLDSLEEDYRKDGIRLHRFLEALPRVNVDPVQIQQVIHHILDNAREAIGKDGTVTVRTEADWDRGCVRITVSDSGPGIPPEYLDRIFDPFFTTKGVVSGGAHTGAKGLGLSIAKGIIEAHDGKIYTGNVLPHGASFIIELPLPGARVETPGSPSTY